MSVNGGDNSGHYQDGVEEEVHHSAIDGGLEGVRQLNPRQGKVCGYMTLGSKHSSCPGRDAGKG